MISPSLMPLTPQKRTINIRKIPRRGMAFQLQRWVFRLGLGGSLIAVRDVLGVHRPSGPTFSRVSVVANPYSQGWLVEVKDRRFICDRRSGDERRECVRWEPVKPLRRGFYERRFGARSAWNRYYINESRHRDLQ